ncbi:Dps family protein [Rhizobium sp. L1K21]|uniref:Dps family protein n=1 Tax=Rhizobium sp. L1K21 TaxID=2954933 RepID=UPI002093EA65|nr:DNA starvation/stationary phase protection protein [Rhizobium sp. L1K21]MCO6184676.1 DNA starvation/stationary phase protection protein [Rhizobium sp. L1K21]
MANTVKALKAHSHEEDIDIGLSGTYRAEISKSLTEILAGTYRLTIKSHIYHWNVVGPLFKPLHELTEEHYEALFASADIIAERIRALGHLAPVSMGDTSNLTPKKGETDHDTANEMIADLIADHEAAVKLMRKTGGKAGDAGDLVTEDMLTARLTFHEKALWMLRAILSQ